MRFQRYKNQEATMEGRDRCYDRRFAIKFKNTINKTRFVENLKVTLTAEEM